MASNMLPFRPMVVKPATTTASSAADTYKSPNWWAPLFGFSSEPAEYMNHDEKKSKPRPAAAGDCRKPAKTRLSPGSFTEEKARQYRRMTRDASSFHDNMYHSAIASRLASDFSDRFAAPS